MRWGFGRERLMKRKKTSSPNIGSALVQPWRPMRTAPKDGTEIECLVYHRNRRYAKKADKHEWTDIVTAHWTNHNSGGWVWRGMMGQFRGWRPNV